MRNSPLITFLIVVIFNSSLQAQFIFDDFSDGSLLDEPQWSGNLKHFRITENSLLQLDFQGDSIHPVSIQTSISQINSDTLELSFRIKLDFPPSNNNKFRLYLLRDSVGQNQADSYEYYFLEIGENGSNDALKIFHHQNGEDFLLGEGMPGEFAESFDKVIKIIIQNRSEWRVYQKDHGKSVFAEESHFSHQFNQYFETLKLDCYFSATRSDKFFFDDIYFGAERKDTLAPEVRTHWIVSEDQLAVSFNEMLQSDLKIEGIQFLEGNEPREINTLFFYGDSVVFSLAAPFTSGSEYQLVFDSLQDLSGNTSLNESYSFLYLELVEGEPGDIIINELLPDPSPVVGLPNHEMVELYNRSAKYINLMGYSITDLNTTASLPAFILAPGQYVILCEEDASGSYSAFGEVIVPSRWPSLNNDEDHVVIKAASGVTIDSLKYDRAWYGDEDKSTGGYTLERINPLLTCNADQNFAAANSQTGGTPGQKNSIYDNEYSGESLELISYVIDGPKTLRLSFSAELNTEMVGEIEMRSSFNASVESKELFTERDLLIQLNEPIPPMQLHTIELFNVQDCNRNDLLSNRISIFYDNQEPSLQEIFWLSDSAIIFVFDEPLQLFDSSLVNVNQVSFKPISLKPNELLAKASSNDFENGAQYLISFLGIADTSRNWISESLSIQSTADFLKSPQFSDLIITELMLRPGSSENNTDLPKSQYVEIYNTTEKRLSLSGVQFTDLQDTAVFNETYIKPKEYLLLLPQKDVEESSNISNKIGLNNFPYLNLTADYLQILNAYGEIIYDLSYTDDWFEDEEKRVSGGWSLEMIDIDNACTTQGNWIASQSDKGGTPAKKNSVSDSLVIWKNSSLILEKVVAGSPNSIKLVFSEAINLDDLSREKLKIFPEITISSIRALSSKSLELNLSSPLITEQTYKLTMDELESCSGRTYSFNTKFGLVQQAEFGDLIITEILFNPYSGGVDFVELYNKSSKHLNLKNWKIENQGSVSEIFKNLDFVVAPQEYYALTEEPGLLFSQYPYSSDSARLVMVDLPEFSNSEGECLLYNEENELINELTYREDMHLPFLRSFDGVSLEKINFKGEFHPSYFRSASEHAGFATPGMKNSQQQLEERQTDQFYVEPMTFAPDHRSRNFTSLHYSFDTGNQYQGSVTVYNIQGIKVKTLLNNVSLSQSGFIRWDGDDETGRKVGPGYYFFSVELFDTVNLITERKVLRVAVGF